MRTNTIPEKIFSHETYAHNYVVGIHDYLMIKLRLFQTLEYSLDELFFEVCHYLDQVPLYHRAELSIADAIIRINLEISILNPIEGGVPVYNCSEIFIVFGVADFLTEKIDNGYLSYNPAEGF